MELKKALEEIRKQDKRKFDQSIDLIITLKKFNARKDSVNLAIALPHKIKEKKVCAFLMNKSKIIDTVTKDDFAKYSDAKKVKELEKGYDFFISIGSLMPAVATTFGRVLGPAKKMPSPQLGVLMSENDATVKEVVDRINKTARAVTRSEPCIKVVVAKESMKDEDIIENIKTIYNSVLNSLPSKKENIRKCMIKTSMGKPIKFDAL